ALALDPRSQDAAALERTVRGTMTTQAQQIAAAEATAATKVAFDARVQSTQRIDPRRLVSDPQGLKGQDVLLFGQTLNVTPQGDYPWVQLLAADPGYRASESIVVEIRPKDPRVLKDECIRVYGNVAGVQRVTQTLTEATREVPKVDAFLWEPWLSLGR